MFGTACALEAQSTIESTTARASEREPMRVLRIVWDTMCESHRAMRHYEMSLAKGMRRDKAAADLAQKFFLTTRGH